MKRIMLVLALIFSLSVISARTDAQAKVKVVNRKGTSNAAKGAVVGGVGGALAGAAISHDHSKGAIIGGVAGATGGYLIGRHKDKKYGRKRVHKYKTVK